MKRSYIRRKKHADPVTLAMHAYVMQRDGGCVAPRLDMEGECEGRVELDHILNGGTGKRGPSTALNLVALCQFHHRAKTDNARAWRPLLIEYVCTVEAA